MPSHGEQFQTSKGTGFETKLDTCKTARRCVWLAFRWHFPCLQGFTCLMLTCNTYTCPQNFRNPSLATTSVETQVRRDSCRVPRFFGQGNLNLSKNAATSTPSNTKKPHAMNMTLRRGMLPACASRRVQNLENSVVYEG